MKVIQRVPLDNYAYIEFEQEYDSPQEAIAHNAELVKMNTEKGLPEREWAQLRNRMLVTGEMDVNKLEHLSKAQAYFVNQLKLALRSHTAQEPVIE